MRLILTQLTRRSVNGASDVRSVAALVAASRIRPGSDDVLVLPELIGGESSELEYEADIGWLARSLGLHVVGGSHHCRRGRTVMNRGIVVDPSGTEVGRYEKAFPYGAEARLEVERGSGGGRFNIGNVSFLVLICSDFWYPPSPETTRSRPDVVLVPAFSVSQRPTPDVARARWRHAAVARAYDLPAFVGISDWAHPIHGFGGTSSGAAGLAHPNPSSPRHLFRGLGRRSVMAVTLDLDALRDLRANLLARNFRGVPNWGLDNAER